MMTDASQEAISLMRSWIALRVPHEVNAWFGAELEKLRGKPSDRDLYLAIGYAPRRLGKGDLNLAADDLAAANAVRPGWNPSDWSIDQAARLAFILASFDHDAQRFRARVEQLFRTADIGELIAFYRGLPLYPAAQLYVGRAREGARSGMQPLFEAVAHRNPYPREQFDENAWNHMVLKALFIGSRLDPIQGLDARANPTLTRMLCDYAHERWAADRPVSPELWRCVGPFADAAALADLERVMQTGGALERQAAALALTAVDSAEATALLMNAPEMANGAGAGKLSWSAVSLAAHERGT